MKPAVGGANETTVAGVSFETGHSEKKDSWNLTIACGVQYMKLDVTLLAVVLLQTESLGKSSLHFSPLS